MEQSTLSDSTRMPAAQVETRDPEQEARVATLLTGPRDPAPPFSAAAEVSLAHMVVDYFGSEDIHPALNCDIALRDRARAILAAAAEPDPIFAAIEKDRALAAEHIRLLSISGSKPDEDPSWEPTHDASDALWAHWDDVLLKTVPTTAAGCAALARYTNEWSEREGLDLSEAGPKIFDLIGRSPLLTAPDTPPAFPDPIFAALRACWAPEAEREAFHAVHSRGSTGPGYTFEREMALDSAVEAVWDTVFATMPTTQAGRLALTAFIERRIEWSACPDGSPQDGEDTVFAQAYHALARLIRTERIETGFDLPGLSMLQLSNLMEDFEAGVRHWIGVECAPWARMKAGRRTAAGEIAGFECDRQARIRDAIAAEIKRRPAPAGEDRDIQLEAQVRYELMCNGSLREAPALLAAITRQWGAQA